MAVRRVSRRLRLTGTLAALCGVALLVWSIRQGGTTAVLGGVERVGVGIIVVCLIGGLRGLIRAAAWRLCLDKEHRPTLGSVFSAYLSGDAIGNVTPFGLLISEPSKIVLVRPSIDVEVSVAALTVENLFYSATVVLLLVAGTAALLLSFGVSRPVKLASLTVVALAVALALLAAWIVSTRRRLISGAVEWMIRKRIGATYWPKHLPDIRQTGDRIFEFVTRRRRAVLPLLALEFSYHIAAVLEIWYVIGLITGASPGLLTAFVLEYVNRTITIAFQFVPMWIGVDEAGTSLATNVLGLGSPAGVSLALVRKARIFIWTAIGLILLVHRGVAVNALERSAPQALRRFNWRPRRHSTRDSDSFLDSH
jgi:Lysylphosphatidylglycerol synthase TM region